jgi:hypothetical protein
VREACSRRRARDAAAACRCISHCGRFPYGARTAGGAHERRNSPTGAHTRARRHTERRRFRVFGACRPRPPIGARERARAAGGRGMDAAQTRGGLALVVLVEGGTSSGVVAAPIAARFFAAFGGYTVRPAPRSTRRRASRARVQSSATWADLAAGVKKRLDSVDGGPRLARRPFLGKDRVRKLAGLLVMAGVLLLPVVATVAAATHDRLRRHWHRVPVPTQQEVRAGVGRERRVAPRVLAAAALGVGDGVMASAAATTSRVVLASERTATLHPRFSASSRSEASGRSAPSWVR